MQQSELITQVKQMSAQDFALLGLHQLAYVKPIEENGHQVFAVFAANGTQIANIEHNRDVAFAAVRQHELEPVSVH